MPLLEFSPTALAIVVSLLVITPTKENLGLATTDYGTAFESRNADRPDEINYLNWSPFAEDTDYFNPSKSS